MDETTDSERKPLQAPGQGNRPGGCLYLVATPIGNARDITLRALDILAGADILAAEDTRNTRRLLDIHGIRRDPRSIWPYHDHNGPRQRPRLLAALAEGRSVALVSDAGTPMVADPGFPLVREAVAAGHAVTAAPGASAVLTALAISALPTDRFLFAGFLPPKAAARARALADLAAVPASLVVYETPRRLAECLAAMAGAFGPERPAAICRELTKRFEEAHRGTLAELAAHYAEAPEPKGEIVIVTGPPLPRETGPEEIDALLRAALASASVKDAAAQVAADLGLPRRDLYRRALELDARE